MTEDVEELQTMVRDLTKDLLRERERNRNLEAERDDLMNEICRTDRP